MITVLAIKKICNELQWICSDTSSILKNKEDKALLTFDWQLIFDEAKQHTPIFFNLLLNCLARIISSRQSLPLVQYTLLLAI